MDKTIESRIHSIRVLRFHQEEPEKPFETGENFIVNTRLTTGVDQEEKKLQIRIDVDIRQTEESPILVSIATAMIFDLKGDITFVVNQEGKHTIPTVILNPLASVAYSTTRGILFAKTGASVLSSLILPLMPITKLTDQFKLSESEPSD